MNLRFPRKRTVVSSIPHYYRRLRLEQLENRALMCNDFHGPLQSLPDGSLNSGSDLSGGQASRLTPSIPYDGNNVEGDTNGTNWIRTLDNESLEVAMGAIAPALIGIFTPPSLSFSTLVNGMPILNSLVGAPTSIFLDFDGDTTNTGTPTTPYDVDGNSTTFNAAEQASIAEAWRHIATYFAMFNTNVTTIQPPSTTPTAWDAIGNNIVGGFSNVNVVPNSVPRSHNNSGDARTRQSGIAHEFGHNWGLSHQSDFDLYGVETADYSSGYDQLHVPIMGVDFAQRVRKWAIGHTSNASGLQDDVEVIRSKIASYQVPAGDGFRPDDYLGTIALATPLTSSNSVQYASGIIERLNDVDAFSFSSTGQPITVSALADFPSGVDLKLEIYDALGVLVAAKDANLLNDQEITLVLPSGTYYALVSSHGNFGDLGTYNLAVRSLPAGWSAGDVGVVGVTGFSQYHSAISSFVLGASGADIGGTVDEMQFARQTLTGNGTIIARVASITNTTANSKAGIEIRESTAENAKHVSLTPTSSSGVKFIRRSTTGGTSTTISSAAAAFAPVWVRLQRVGDLFTASTSSDGTTWTTLGTATVAMNATVQIGLVATAQNDRLYNIAEFDNVSVTGTLGVTPPSLNFLTAPTGVNVTRSTGSNLSISWNDQVGETGYRVERSIDGAVFTTAGTTAADVTTFDNAGLVGTMRYFYRVLALDASGASVPSTVVSELNRPSEVGNLELTSYSTTQVVLDWIDTSGETGYRIERATDGVNFTTIATVATNIPSYTNSSLTSGATYQYRVIPTSAFGDGPAVTTTGGTRLQQVTGLAFDSLTSSQTVFHWTDIPTETNYRIERSTDGVTYSQLAIVANNITTYTDTTVLPTTEYYYRVLGTAGQSVSLYNLIFSATPPATALTAPWSAVDIGTVSGAGSTSLTSGTFKIISSGSTIGGTTDSFRFTSQPLHGDGSITARVASLENTAGSAQLGVMIRESLTATSRQVSISLKPPTTTVSLLSRSTTAGSTTTVSGATTSAPYWVRLTRAGDVFTGQTSPDGVTWTTVGQATVVMASSAYMGLAATANSTTLLNTATATNVTATQTLADPVVTVTSSNQVYSNTAYTATASITGNNAPAPTLSYVFYSNAGGTTIIPAPKNVGTYYVRAFSAANAGNFAAQSSIATFQITPLAITGSIAAANKIFDGTLSATVTSRTLNGVLGTDVVSYVGGTALFDTSAVGNGKTVTATGLLLSGVSAGNYTVNSTAVTTANINPVATIAQGYVFYNDSGFETFGGVSAAIDNVGKQLLQSSGVAQTTTVANVSNYIHGINGLVFDVNNLAATTLSASDFVFRMRQNTVLEAVTPVSWVDAPAPTVVDVTPGAPSRIRLEWDNNAIQNTWLQVIFKANANTGLAVPVVFYIGHAAGEGAGSAPYRVGVAELSAIQTGISSAIRSITDVRDVDKNRRVGVSDVSFVQPRVSSAILLSNITIPIAGSVEEGAPLPTPVFGSLVLANEGEGNVSSFAAPPLATASAVLRNSVLSLKLTPVSLITIITIQTRQPVKPMGQNDSAPTEIVASRSNANQAPSALVSTIDEFFQEFGRKKLIRS